MKQICIIGPSGTGKTDLAKYIKMHIDDGLALINKELEENPRIIADILKNLTPDQVKKHGLEKLVKEVDDQDTGIKLQGEFHFCNIIS